MITRQEIKLIQSLHLKKNRKESGLFVVEGLKSVRELSASKIPIVKVFCTHKPDELDLQGLPLIEISEIEMGRISHLDQPSPVLALAKIPASSGPRLMDSMLVLDQIQDPGNAGTLVRTAAWFGIKQVVLSKDSADLYSPKGVQSTMGSLFRMEIHYADIEKVLAESKLDIYAATLQGQKPGIISTPFILVIGNEGHGIRSEILPKRVTMVRIPGAGTTESLNAAVAGSILMYHFCCVGNSGKTTN